MSDDKPTGEDKPESGRKGKDARGRFTKKNPFAFPPGVSGNPKGKPSVARLSTAYKRLLYKRCDDKAVLKAAGLKFYAKESDREKHHPQWAEVIALAMARTAVIDGTVTAAKEIRETTEGSTIKISPEYSSLLKAVGVDPEKEMESMTQYLGEALAEIGQTKDRQGQGQGEAINRIERN
jgi:hypothetical protein